MTHLISLTAPTYAPRCHPWMYRTDPAGVTALLARWTENLAGRTLARVQGVGSRQQHDRYIQYDHWKK